MKNEFYLDLSAITDMSHFCSDINKFIKSDVIAHGNRPFNYEVDARSFIGLSSVCRSPVTVIIISDNENELNKFAEICSEYEIKEK